jgi:CrcB protein
MLFVALGGALGSVARFLLSKLLQGSVITSFPVGTMVVNILGCLLIGIFYGIFDRSDMLDANLKLFLTVGFCGGFTTFSTFMNESLQLFRSDNILYGALYAGGSVFLGLIAVFLGNQLIKAI